ncbi:MAG: hypothetical protein ABI276_06390 [Acidimicrobiales bacterium]
MRKLIVACAAALVFAAPIASCSSSAKPISKADFQSQVADQLKKAGGTDAQASCISDKVYGQLTDSEKKAVKKGKGSKSDENDYIKKLTDAATACGYSGTSGASSTDSGSTSN